MIIVTWFFPQFLICLDGKFPFIHVRRGRRELRAWFDKEPRS